MPNARILRTLFGLIFAIAPLSAAEPAKPAIVAHRGMLKHAPENTLANFRACLELRLGFEFDVARTRDGHLVCIHDDTVGRTTGGTGKVSEMTLEQVRRLDAGRWFGPEFAGERVPTIDEVLSLIAAAPRTGAVYAVDLKVPGVEPEIVAMAVKHGVLDRLLFIGRTIVDPGVRADLRRASPDAITAVVAHDPAELAAALNDPDANWVYFRYLPSEQDVTKVHKAGRKAFLAGVTVAGHEPANWRRATEAGVDAILTDESLALAAILRVARTKP